MSRTYYDVLGVPEDADADAIRAAYRERAKETHPDLSDDSDAGDRFRLVTEAREVLTDSDERRRYDRVGHDRYVSDSAGAGTETNTPGSSPTDDSSRRAHKRRERARRKYAEARREYRHHRRETDGDDWQNGWWKRNGRAGGDEPHERDPRRETPGGSSTAGPFTASGTAATANPGSGTSSGTGATTGSGYRVTRSDPPGPRFTPAKLGLAALTFLLYPVFLASSLLPAFPLLVNVVVGVCTLLLVTYLLSMPEAGVLVFGGWTLLAPVLLLSTGVGLFTPLGFFAWTACLMPCTLAVANLVFLSA